MLFTIFTQNKTQASHKASCQTLHSSMQTPQLKQSIKGNCWQQASHKQKISRWQKTMTSMALLMSFGMFATFATIAQAGTDVWVANGDGTVSDVATGLLWQQQDDGVVRDHAAAITYCEGLTLAGYSDWRLPNVKELISLVDYRRDSPSIDVAAFPNTQSVSYWSTSSIVSSSSVLAVNFSQGASFYSPKDVPFYVRCVR